LIDVLTVIAPILSAVAGGLIGFLSARAMWRAQERQRLRNVATGFLLEISALEKMLTGYANMLSGPGLFKVDTPIYPPTGLYRTLQREVFSFDPALSQSLFQFYLRVMEAEQLRTMDPRDPRYGIMQEGAGAALRSAVSQLPALRKALAGHAGTAAGLLTPGV